MTDIEIKEAEKTLNQKERRYCQLMRKSFETALNDRKLASQFHAKALKLREEILNTRIALDLDYA